MSDLDLVERFRADLPPADPAALSRARARMFHEPAPPFVAALFVAETRRSVSEA